MTKTLLCIHGAGGGAWEYAKWRPIVAAAGLSLVAHDLLPQAADLATTTIDDYLTQIHGWLPPTDRPILVGASMGGILALTMAARINPLALILINSVPPAGIGASRADKQYPAIVRWANGPLEETRTALFDSDDATIEWAWPRWRDESGTVLRTIAQGVTAEPPTCPTLVVLSERDTDISYQTGLALAAWAKADVHLYHGMSHVGPLLSRRAEEVAQAVVGWCGERLDEGR